MHLKTQTLYVVSECFSFVSYKMLQGRCAEDLYKGIQSSDAGVRCDSLKELASVSTDVTFAQEFISRVGHLLLVKIVEESNELVFSVCVCMCMDWMSVLSVKYRRSSTCPTRQDFPEASKRMC